MSGHEQHSRDQLVILVVDSAVGTVAYRSRLSSEFGQFTVQPPAEAITIHTGY